MNVSREEIAGKIRSFAISRGGEITPTSHKQEGCLVTTYEKTTFASMGLSKLQFTNVVADIATEYKVFCTNLDENSTIGNMADCVLGKLEGQKQ